VTHLEQLPARIDDLASQVSRLRTEMRVEFSTVRADMAGQGVTLRGEMAEQGEALRREFRTEIGNLANQMRVLHEEVISRIALLQEGWSGPRRGRPRKK
jgi:hypothetical protein